MNEFKTPISFFNMHIFFPVLLPRFSRAFHPKAEICRISLMLEKKKNKKKNKKKKNALRQADGRTPTCLTACCQEIQSQTPTLAVSLRASLPTAGVGGGGGACSDSVKKTLSFHLFMASSRDVGGTLVNIQVAF